MVRAVVWSGPAKRSLERLPPKVAMAIVEFIYGQLADNAERAGKPLRLDLAGAWAARRGDYRIVYQIAGDEVVVVAVAHRSDIYRRR